MLKIKYLTSILLFFTLCSSAQPLPFDQHVVDSIVPQLPLMRDDTNKVKNLIRLSQMYIAKGNGNLVLQYANEADSISKKIQYNIGRIEALGQMAFYHATTGDWPQSIIEINEAFPLTKNENTHWAVYLLNFKFINYSAKNDFKVARMWALRALNHPTFQNLNEMDRWPTYMQLGLSYEWDNQLDSAQYYADILQEYVKKYHHADLEGNTYLLFGNIARKKKQYDEALHYYRLGAPNLLGIAWVYDEQNRADSAIHYAKLALDVAQTRYDPRTILESSQILARHYAKTDPLQSNKYLKLYVDTKDTLFNANKMKELEDIRLNEQRQRFEQIGQAKAFRSKTIQYSLMGLAGLLLISALFFFRNNQIKKVANAQLEKSNVALKIAQTELEDKNRDLEIEAALERVRARTMAMQHSNDLQETALLLFNNVKALGVAVFGCGFNIWDEDRKAATAWMAGENRLQPPFKTSSSEDVFLQIHEATQQGHLLFVKEQSGDVLEKHYRYMSSIPTFQTIMEQMSQTGTSVPAFQIIHCAFFHQGYLMFITYEPVPEAYDIFIRFGKVFEQTYTRFLDLQKAEAQAREAQIEVSLERVRSRTMGMQTSEELADVAFVLLQQIRTLGGNLWGSGFGLCEKDSDLDSFWFANENGVFPPVSVPNTTDPAHKQMFQGWKDGKDFLAVEGSGNVLKSHYDYMISLPEVRQFFQKIIDEGLSFPEWQQWNAAYFKQGYLLIITLEPYPDSDILKRFAKVFEQTYTRFLDLQKAEEQGEQARLDLIQIQTEKKRAENALTILKAAQTQLIQSEKLASLGELTAGIAHEIQNPLNFVNNFSELSVDLVKDLKEEINKPEQDKEYIGELFDDLSSNQEKINHHGKRASSIVKGMLEHSRTSTGERALTDINALADEYLRLSYHGMRAKDKNFNSDYQTDLDENMPKIEVIPQDLGRVLLNLINNAFYAVHQRHLQEPNHTPSVLVSTHYTAPPLGAGGTIIIKVKDNGVGMSESVRAKVFQPFFTTKPTGQGTGLGLSLAYDIVTKGHGGTLEVESTEGVGSEFILKISL